MLAPAPCPLTLPCPAPPFLCDTKAAGRDRWGPAPYPPRLPVHSYHYPSRLPLYSYHYPPRLPLCSHHCLASNVVFMAVQHTWKRTAYCRRGRGLLPSSSIGSGEPLARGCSPARTAYTECKGSSRGSQASPRCRPAGRPAGKRRNGGRHLVRRLAGFWAPATVPSTA